VLDGSADLGDVLVGDDGDASVIALNAGTTRGDRPFSSRSADVDDVVRQLGVGFDNIVFDMPPILESSTALTMFRLADAYMFVILAGVTRSDQVRRATRQLAEVPLLGSVLNQHRVRIPKPLRRIGEE
jgi:Mrp family chromosome partitioning ATPase